MSLGNGVLRMGSEAVRATALLLPLLFWTAISPAASDENAEELRRATKLHDIGSYGEALAVYKKLLEADPKNVTLLYEAGLTAKALGDLKACIDYANQAVATEQRPAMTYALLGSCQDDAGDPKAALASFEKGLALAPTDSQLNFNYALTLARQGKVAETRKHAGIAIENDRTRATAYLLYASTMDVMKLEGAAALMRLRFMMLELHTSRAVDAATAIARQAAEYRRQAAEKTLVLNGLPENPSPDTELTLLNLAFGLSVGTEHKYLPADASEAARFVHAMQNLLTVTREMHEKARGLDFVWQNAAVPLQDLARQELLETFLYLVAGLAKLDGALPWLEDHSEQRLQVHRVLQAGKARSQ
jgi:tetratricopeptide (TPR) repeat protein